MARTTRGQQQSYRQILQRLDDARRFHGYTIDDLASKMAKSPASVSRKLSGQQVITVETLIDLAKMLNIEFCIGPHSSRRRGAR